MKSVISTFLLLLLFGGAALAQNKAAVVKGKVLDNKDQPLPMATVMLLQAKDSVLSTFGMSDDKGAFALQKTSKGEYILQITFLGYQNFQKAVSITGMEESIEIGDVKLDEQSELLSEVVVQAEANPLNI